MFSSASLLLASFTSPESIGTNPQSMFWILPLAAAISIVYKTIKVPEIKTRSFIKDTFMLFGSIVLFIIAAAVTLCLMAYLATE